VWDYQTKACMQTLDGHGHNISCVAYHPELPVILSGSEDGTVKLWHATTYRLENSLNYGMERVWSIGVMKGSNSVALGFDEGVAVVKIGREEPVASMDSGGKIVWARHNEVQAVNVRSLGADGGAVADGERLPLAVKELGACDIYPQSLKHSPNGRFVAVCGDGEYVIYTALAWRNKSFGAALEAVWSADGAEYAVREPGSKVRLYDKNFKEKATLRVDFAADGLYGGALVGVKGPDFVCFYDWADGRLLRRIDAGVRDVIWSDGGELVAIVGDQGFYVLQFNR
jgi:coatomer subunit beta'